MRYIGIRVVCPFQDDVFHLAEEISRNIGYEVVNIKDFFSKPKSSGYRSIHIILACNDAFNSIFLLRENKRHQLSFLKN